MKSCSDRNSDVIVKVRGCAGVLVVALAMLSTSRPIVAHDVQVLRNVRVVTMDGADDKLALRVLERASVVIRDGKIAEVAENVAVPLDAAVYDLDGRWLLPGFVDAHFPIGQELLGEDANEFTEIVTEDFDVLTAYDPWDDGLAAFFELGVTSRAVSPGDKNIVGGPVRVVKIAPGVYPPPVIDGPLLFKVCLTQDVLGGRGLPRYPTSTSGAMAVFRSWVESRRDSEPARILVRLETRTEAETVARILAKHPTLTTVLSQGRPQGSAGSLDDGLERLINSAGWRRLPQYKEVVLGPLHLGDPAWIMRVPAALERRGVRVAFASDGYPTKDLLTTAVLACRQGLSLEGAVAALTAYPAGVLGVQDRIGRVAPGFDADLVVWTDNPLTLQGRVEHVWVAGKRVFSKPDDRTRRNLARKSSETPTQATPTGKTGKETP